MRPRETPAQLALAVAYLWAAWSYAVVGWVWDQIFRPDLEELAP